MPRHSPEVGQGVKSAKNVMLAKGLTLLLLGAIISRKDYEGPLAYPVPQACQKVRASFQPSHTLFSWLKQATIILVVVLTFFMAPSVWTATNSDSSSGSQPEKLSVRSYPHPELQGQLQFLDKAAQRDPAQRLKAQMPRKADRELAQAQPPPQPPKPFQKAVLQVAAFFSFGAGTRARAGSGALITPEGHLLTNSHIIRLGPGYCAQPPVQGDVAPLIVLLVTEDLQKPPIPRYVADLVTDDPHLDIAVLKISRELKEGLNNLQELEEKVSAAGSRDAFLNQWAKEGLVRSIPIQPLTLWDSDAALVGQRVTALGYPRPDDKLRNPSLNTDDRGNIQAKPEGFLRVGAAFAAPGSSGGAVVRAEEGREYLIGLICAGEFGTGQGVALARPINAAVDSPIKAAKLTINQAPVARFVPKPDLPRPRETVIFDALEQSRDRDGSIQECQWQIKENGQSLTLPGCRVERSFPPDSQPKVTLAVRDDKGMSDAFTQEILLKVEEGPCRAKLRQASGAVQEFDSIQTAINQAGSGDVIEVIPPTPPRACAESLEIKGKRELTLRGARSIEEAPAFVLAGDGAKPTVLITDSESITLQGLTITQGNPGVRVENSRAIRLKQSILKANRVHGILWVNSSGRVSDDSRMEGNLTDLQGRFGHGLTADQKSIVDLIDTEIARNADAGITVLGESELKLDSVQVRGNNDGVVLDGAKQVTLRDVKVYSNRKVGISTKTAALTIASSRIEGNEEYGLLVTNATVEITEKTAISNNRDGLEVRGSATVSLSNSTASNNKEDGLVVRDSATVRLTNTQISENDTGITLLGGEVSLESAQISRNRTGIDMLGGQATISKTQISQNRRFGISIFDGSVTLQRGASLSNNFVGIFVAPVASARVALFNASVSDNSFLGIWLNSGQATIQNSTISGNGLQGIAIVGTKVMISGTVVDGNGTFPACSRPDQICNGITVEGWAKATIVDSTLRNNTDWGLSAVLKKCGYPSDGFTGGVTFQGSNTITGNNKARNHEGEICLP
jgi:parallel beta-helix repeat protein